MPMHSLRIALASLLSLSFLAGASASQADELTVAPAEFELRGAHASQQLVVTAARDGFAVDVTSEAEFSSSNAQIARVDAVGRVYPVGDGQAVITVTVPAAANAQAQRVESRVTVRQATEQLPVSFELDVQPILTARGCNQGACHGKARGQNGFQLSLLAFDPEFDFHALTREGRGRRVFPAAPQRSLLLQKASAQVPHGGGLRLPPDGADYQTLLRWIEAGMPRAVEGEPKLVGIEVLPSQMLMKPGQTQQLLVTAIYSNGERHDVTRRTSFQSNEAAIVAVDDQGVMTAGPIPGEATIMARYMSVITTTEVAIPLEGSVPDDYYQKLTRKNLIDDLVYQKLKQLNITVSEPVDDARFLRRAYIDIIGTVPTPEEVRQFLADPAENKRELLVDRLVDRPEYAEHWANKWADLLRPNPYRVGIKATLNYDYWIRDSFRKNKPYDQFVRELITARGSTWRNGATTLFRDRRSPDEIGTLVSQLFLGVRLECAKCHHHPFEKWSQEDFYSFAAFFARVGRKGTGLSPPISGGEEIILTAASGSVSHPLTNEVLEPTPLFGELTTSIEKDPREALAAWVTSPENDYFAQTITNRVWADLMGRGLVEPVDDLRATNPPSNAALLKALADDFRDHNFDLKHLIRRITLSHVYGLSSLPTERNVSDVRNYSRHYRQRLRAEVLIDAIRDIADTPVSFEAMPDGSLAKEIWTHRVSSLFLDTFGRPDPNQDPPCERTGESTVTQALHLMNAPQLHQMIISDKGRAAALAASDRSPEQIVEELYLLVYNRFPSAEELEVASGIYQQDGVTRRQVTEDLMWALINTPEFLFKD